MSKRQVEAKKAADSRLWRMHQHTPWNRLSTEGFGLTSRQRGGCSSKTQKPAASSRVLRKQVMCRPILDLVDGQPDRFIHLNKEGVHFGEFGRN